MAVSRSCRSVLALVVAALPVPGCKKEPSPPSAPTTNLEATATVASSAGSSGYAEGSPSRARAVRQLRAAALFPSVKAAEEVLGPAITIKTVPASGKIDRGASRFGGLPDVPSGFEWPTHIPPRDEQAGLVNAQLLDGGEIPQMPSLPDGKTRVPLNFLAEIDLASVARAAAGHEAAALLPATGQLYFFYDVEHGGWGFDPKLAGGFRVLYRDVPATALERAVAPAELKSKEGVYPTCSLSLEPSWSLPSYGDVLYEGLGIGNDEAKGDAYGQLALTLLGQPPKAQDGIHHLLGHPQVIQNDMRLEAQLVSHGLYTGDGSGYQSSRAEELAAGAADWILLLQIDSDDRCPGWMWGDVGRLYFWIRKQDLKAKRFDKTWMALQCY